MLNAMAISEQYEETNLSESIASLEDSPAKTSACKVQSGPLVKGWEESALVFGGRCLGSFAWWDPSSSLWRTWQQSMETGWEQFWEAFPAAGMIVGGIAYQLPPLVCPIYARGLSWLPTMGATEYKGAATKRFVGSPHFRGSRMSEGLRTSEKDPIYLHPSFAEAAMGFLIGWTDLEVSETPLSPKSPNGSAEES